DYYCYSGDGNSWVF
nr:immunoglobulin light chain junction region [Macaca mulatta]MOW15242.1 immunoglobulin light chain junction region [Macaca mulatta]MOW16581.1 immunoglobulin light chain junction region [Macaca mulatta]MOW18426.1 immunoglobulin light chain junction region [Macaca mulatta]